MKVPLRLSLDLQDLDAMLNVVRASNEHFNHLEANMTHILDMENLVKSQIKLINKLTNRISILTARITALEKK